MIGFTPGELAQTACIWEAVARKVGNVHRSADFLTTTLTDFLISAAAIAGPLKAATRNTVGTSILSAVKATHALVEQNTNLGIILLLAPLCAVRSEGRLRSSMQDILNSLTADDARSVYEAIRVANPGGLGDAPEQDVRAEPTVTLLEAMRLAADRDAVARQYANGYADVFDLGVPAFLEAFAKFGCVEAAVIESQLRLLATHLDSLIARKNGHAIADDVRRRAGVVQQFGGIATPEGRAAGVALDRHLRSDGNKLNPGTTADLITACLFVALRENKVTPSAPFRWHVTDWL